MREYRDKMMFALVVGILYVIFGIIQFLGGLGLSAEWIDMLLIPPDLFGGAIVVLIGAIFLYGVKELKNGIREGVSYVYVGILFSLGFFIVYLLIMGADAISAYGLGSEDFIDWTPLDDMRPAIYLGLLSLLGFLVWRNKFTMNKLTKAGP
jgi:hypothetical protein